MKTNILKILSAKGVVAIFMIAMANALYAQQDKKETNTATADKYAQMFSEPDMVQPVIYSSLQAGSGERRLRYTIFRVMGESSRFSSMGLAPLR